MISTTETGVHTLCRENEPKASRRKQVQMAGRLRSRLVDFTFLLLPLLLSSAAPTPDHRFASPPCKPVPRGHLAAPSWLLILPAHSVVASAWEEPGGAPAGTLTQCRHRTVPKALGVREPRHPSGGSAWPTRPRPHTCKLRHSVVLKAGDPSSCVLKFECLWTVSAFVLRFPGFCK